MPSWWTRAVTPRRAKLKIFPGKDEKRGEKKKRRETGQKNKKRKGKKEKKAKRNKFHRRAPLFLVWLDPRWTDRQ
jgi:hypothetical protein